MKALVKAKAEPGIWLEDVPMPKIGVNDILVKIKKTAICGTDLHIYRWDKWSQQTIKTPMTIGHEWVGEIIEMGSGVTGWKIGERVTGEGHIACGHCRNCRRGKKHVCENNFGIGVHRDGAFAEYLSIPAANVIRINPDIPDDMVAIMDPYGNATHTTLTFPILGEDVLITGAGGPIGAMCIAIAKFAGARRIVATETNPYRMALAEKMGATRVVNPVKEDLDTIVHDLGMHSAFDVGLECSGSPHAFNDMIKHMYPSGKIALLGIVPPDTKVDWGTFIFKGLTMKGIYGREMFETWYYMEQMLLSGLDLSPVITDHFKIDDFQKGFDLMDSGNCGKVILDWQ